MLIAFAAGFVVGLAVGFARWYTFQAWE